MNRYEVNACITVWAENEDEAKDKVESCLWYMVEVANDDQDIISCSVESGDEVFPDDED